MDRAAGFAKVVRRLPDLEVIRYDRRGYGRSIGLGPCADLAVHAEDLLTVVAATGPGPAAVVGHSFGGLVALTAACGHPELIPSVGAFESPAPWARWWRPTDPPWASPGMNPAEVAEAFLRRAIGDRVWERLPGGTRAERRAEGPALLADLAAMRSAPTFLPEEVEVPVTAGFGTVSDPWHQRAARELGARAPRGAVMALEGATHGAHLGAPDGFARFVHRVVERAGAPESVGPGSVGGR
jgi:pimeloyl-ACP methyl ester carboxylesterase